MSAVVVTADNFGSLVLDSDKPVLVDFWAEWCGPCKTMGPVIDQLADELDGVAVVGKCNVDEQRSLAAMWQIMSIPALMVFHKGKKVDEFIGVQPKDKLAKKLRSLA